MAERQIERRLDRMVQFCRWITGKESLKPLPPDESLGPARPCEIRPPWIEHPSYGPGDGFWRQPGEAWMYYVWEPYYKSLSPEAQAEYLRNWQVPKDWQDFYFDPAWWNDEDATEHGGVQKS